MKKRGENYGKKKCQSCGYQWLARVPEPKACPACKTYITTKKVRT